jgi:hypothetical protein
VANRCSSQGSSQAASLAASLGSSLAASLVASRRSSLLASQAARLAANQKQISVNNNMENNQFIQFSMADGYYWIWEPIIANGNKIGYRKVRLATEEEIALDKVQDS